MGQVIMARRGSEKELLVSVIGGTVQPTGTAGMLWVDTATAIPYWTFAGVQPTSPVTGDVWIQTDAASTNIINLLKKDNTVVKINVLRVKQYNGTAWVAVAAYYYATAWTQISAATFDPATDYTYTGTSQVVDDGSGHWRIKFLTSGKLRFSVAPDSLDVFALGGGGGPGSGGATYGAGAGGRTTTATSMTVQAGVDYSITIGAGGAVAGAGGTTSGLSTSATGGGCGYGDNHGGDGGSGGGGGSSEETGGNGGTNGGNGSSQYGNKNGVGQGTTTYEFGNPTLTRYGGGGGGGSNGVGGAGGGASKGASAAANTGGGGGGSGGKGGSGIVVIRDHR